MACTRPFSAPCTYHTGRPLPDRTMASSMLSIGVNPTPPLSSTTGPSSFSSRKNSPAGGATCSTVPGPAWSWSQLEASPGGTPGVDSRLTVMR